MNSQMIGDMKDKTPRSCKMDRSCLLWGKPYESLRFYTKAIQTSLNARVLEAALNSVDQLTLSSGQRLWNEWARKLLLIGLAAKFPATRSGKAALKQIKEVASTLYRPLESPVIVVAGGCSSKVVAQMHVYRGLVLKAFRDFKGTIISGGTTSGISALVGEVQQEYPSTVRAVGYVPKVKTDLLDKRYSEIRFTEGKRFSPIEPLQYWIDIIASGIKPPEVKLLGINGGRISAFEYRLALAVGASVAIVTGSGMEADKLLLDNDWKKSKNLISMTTDPLTIGAFIKARTGG